MAAHHGPPCGHTILGTCPGCGGGRAIIGVDFGADLRINAAEQTFAREIHGRWTDLPLVEARATSVAIDFED